MHKFTIRTPCLGSPERNKNSPNFAKISCDCQFPSELTEHTLGASTESIPKNVCATGLHSTMMHERAARPKNSLCAPLSLSEHENSLAFSRICPSSEFSKSEKFQIHVNFQSGSLQKFIPWPKFEIP